MSDTKAAQRTAAGNWPYPRLIAHRGAGKLAPENTLTAMRVGQAHHYRDGGIRREARADNVAFLMHDATLERTTTGRGRADALPWRELSRLDAGGWHSAQYAGEALPTFTAIARWARAHGVACNVEIKPTPGRERETGAAVALDAQALWRDAEVPPLLSSFSEDALIAARDAVPELPRALLLDELARRLARAAATPGMRGARRQSQGAERGRRARRARRRLPRARLHAERRGTRPGAGRWGVDGIITDAVDRIAADVLPPAPALSRG